MSPDTAAAVYGFMAVEGPPGGAQPGQGRVQGGLVVLDADQQGVAGRRRLREAVPLTMQRVGGEQHATHAKLSHQHRHRRGLVRRSGRISRCGDTLARTLLYEAAVVLLTRVKRTSPLKDWAQAIAKRSGMGKARVALARKLSVSGEPLGSTILHSIWRSGEPFRWSEQAVAA